MKLVLIFAGVFVTLSAPELAHACGTWKLNDNRSGQEVTFLASTVKVVDATLGLRTAIKISGSPEHFTAIRGHWKRGKKPILFVEGQSIRLRDNVVGELNDNSVVVDGKQYGLSVVRSLGEDRRRYDVTVSDAEGVFAKGTAMSFWDVCQEKDSPAPPTEAVMIADVRNRIALYLVWRDLVDGSPW